MLLPKTDSDAVIVAACRTPIGKFKGVFAATRPENLAAAVMHELLRRVPQVKPWWVEDVLFGCAIPEAEQGMNVARNSVLLAGLPFSVPAATINRCCASGLETIARASERIESGKADIVIAGGVESMSMVPMHPHFGHVYRPHPDLERDTRAYISMVCGAETLRKSYNISRREQDAFALESHCKAVAAQDGGKFIDEITPVQIPDGAVVSADEGPRRDTSLEKLAALKPINWENDFASTVTAGNASQRSDGAAGTLVMSRKRAEELGIKPFARLIDYMVTGTRPEYFGIGPFEAMYAVLRRTGLKKEDIGLVELNEAFAAQALAVLRTIYIKREILNVNGGAIALGHPLGCTGARIAATLIHEMRRRSVEFGLETMCVGGGMGAAGIFQLEDA